MLVTNRHNRQYELDPHPIVQRLFGNGIYQITNIRHLRDLRPQARRIIDVGGNIGTSAIEYATWADAVETFEPTDRTRAYLVANLARNRTRECRAWYGSASMQITAQVTVHAAALSNVTGTAYMTHREHGLADYVAATGDQPCQTATIDSYGWQDIDIIKIDTEGTEWLVVQGADATIRQCRPVVQVEFWDWNRRFGIDNQDMLDYFQGLGYRHTDRLGNDLPWDQPRRITRRLHPTQACSAMDRFFVPQ